MSTVKQFTTKQEKSQEKLELELKNKFAKKKKQNELLSASYSRLGLSKALRVSECGNWLEFAKKSDDSFKLHNANFCRDRLCPMCSWRRSYKIFAQVSKIMTYIQDSFCFLFVTLTVPNCSGSDLSKTVDKLNSSFFSFVRYKRIKNINCGCFKALEITRNPKTGTYHPHLHIVFAVPLSYFKKGSYIQRDEWLALWQKATKDPTITQVDVRRASQKVTSDGQKAVKALSSVVAEIAKYTVKSKDYIIKDNPVLTDEIVNLLDSTLYHRRLCSYSGIFKDVFMALQLQDAEADDADLINVDGELRSDIALQIYRYEWTAGFYKLTEVVDAAEV